MANATRSEKLDLRLAPEEKRVLNAAPQASRRSVSEFVLESALDRAQLIFCDHLTQVGVLSEIFGTFLAIRSATYRDKAGPMIRTSIKRAICCAITNPTSTLVDPAIMATESAPPGLVAR